MDKKLNILWLPGWFPSRVDFLPGDFIERHAKAVSELICITIIYVIKDTELQKAKKQIVKEKAGNLTIYRGYYSGKKEGNMFNKINSVLNYYQLLFAVYRKAKNDKGDFDLCHVHVPLRQSLLAMWLKKKMGLKYVVSEQNAWYMSGNKAFFSQPFFIRWMIKKTFANASAIHVVSNELGKELLKSNCINKPYTVIPNVVNTAIFKPLSDNKKQDSNSCNFIAITGDTFHKNTDGLLRAFADLMREDVNAKLHLVGPNIDNLKKLTSSLKIEESVIFYGAISNEQVAALTQQSDAMIFFTRYETFGCVMAEALCCGIPVIASRLPVLEENLLEGINGLFVLPEDEKELTDKMNWFIQHKNQFNTVAIAKEATRKYNYHSIALQFMDFYSTIL